MDKLDIRAEADVRDEAIIFVNEMWENKERVPGALLSRSLTCRQDISLTLTTKYHLNVFGEYSIPNITCIYYFRVDST